MHAFKWSSSFYPKYINVKQSIALAGSPLYVCPPPHTHTVHQNRGHVGQYRFWPYSSFWTISKSQVRLDKAIAIAEWSLDMICMHWPWLLVKGIRYLVFLTPPSSYPQHKSGLKTFIGPWLKVQGIRYQVFLTPPSSYPQHKSGLNTFIGPRLLVQGIRYQVILTPSSSYSWHESDLFGLWV